MNRYQDKAQNLIRRLESIGVDVDPINNNFMYSHIPVGPLKHKEKGIDKKIFQNIDKNPFSMYIHIPFCESRCDYCDFNTENNPSEEFMEKYMDYLLNKEFLFLEEKVNLNSNKLKSIYIGGGTPTFLKEEKLEKLLQKIKNKTKNVNMEIEAHPNTLTDSKIRLLKDYSIERLSIGIQSFNNKLLEYVRRKSTREQAIYVIEKTLKYFDNLNIDLIYGLPFQEMKHINEDIEIIKSLDIPSVTWYQLWTTSRTNRAVLKISKDVRLSKNETMAAKLMINDELSKLNYINKYNDWYIKSEDITPKYETFRINAQDNIGLGVSCYLFVEPYIFENTSSFDDYFNFIDNRELPIKWYKKMSKEELEIRKLGMTMKTGKIENIDLQRLPKNVKDRINKLIDNKILISKENILEIAPEIIPINKDYLAKHLIGEAWWIKKE